MLLFSIYIKVPFKNYVYKRRGVGGQKKTDLVHVVCERPPISTRGKDYAHHIISCSLDFQTFIQTCSQVQVIVDQVTLSQLGEGHYAHQINTCPPAGFLDLATALGLCSILHILILLHDFPHLTSIAYFTKKQFHEKYLMKY